MTAFELILLVTMGDLIQQGVTQEDMSITGALLAVGTLTLWILVIGYLSFRFKRLRPALDGRAVVVLRVGRPDLDVLRTERITLEELLESARNQGVADVSDVDLAVLEPDGRFSFLRHAGEDGSRAGPKRHTS